MLLRLKRRRIDVGKNIEYYIALPYRIELEKDSDTGRYMARIPLLKGCMTCGDDMFQALVNLEDAKQARIETALDRGLAVPEPEDGIKKKEAIQTYRRT